jgi:hypothetical protein
VIRSPPPLTESRQAASRCLNSPGSSLPNLRASVARFLSTPASARVGGTSYWVFLPLLNPEWVDFVR